MQVTYIWEESQELLVEEMEIDNKTGYLAECHYGQLRLSFTGELWGTV